MPFEFSRIPSTVCRALLSIMVPLSGSFLPVLGQSSFDERDIKAAYLEKLARFVEWPASAGLEDPDAPFVVTILGSDSLNSALENTYREKVFLNRPLELRFVDAVESVGKTHLLFITRSERRSVESILESLDKQPVLTVGDTPGFAGRGVMINLVRHDNRIRFEINRRALDEAGLRASLSLLSLAILVPAQGGYH